MDYASTINQSEILKQTPLKFNSENRFAIGEHDISSLAVKYGTPLFIFDKNKIIENCRKIKVAFASADVGIYYAVKANANLSILGVIRDEFSGVDVNSFGEIVAAKKAGFSYGQMILHGNAKSDEELNYAIKKGVYIIVADSIEELILLNKLAQTLRKKPSVCIRINFNMATGSPWSGFSKNSKFGIPEEILLNSHRILKSLSNITIVGLHAHLGSQILNISLYQRLIKKLFSLANKFSIMGIKVTVINIGGGFPIPYKFHSRINKFEKKYCPHMSLDEWGAKIADTLQQEYARTHLSKRPIIIVEPGRSVVGSGAVLATTVQSNKEYNGLSWLGVDAGCNTLPDCWTYDWYFECLSLRRSRKKMRAYHVAGPLCDTGDVIAFSRLLPKQERGDLLIFTQVGAYQLEQQSNFNLRPRAAAILVDGKAVELIEKRENLRSLL